MKRELAQTLHVPRHAGSVPVAVLCTFLGAAAPAANQFVRMPDLPTKASISWLSAWGDMDNDGYPELIVANGGNSKPETLDLYRNMRDMTFQAMTTNSAGGIVADAVPWMTVVWSDINNDGLLDVVATGYSSGSRQFPRLFLNQPNKSFRSVVAGDLTNTKDYYWSLPPADINGDGWVDLVLLVDSYSSTRSQNRLLLNRGDATFSAVTDGVFGTDRILANAGAWADYDGDGRIDIFLANVLDDNAQHRDRLYHNDGHGRFTSVTDTPLVQTSGVTVHSAWGDFDNDGDLDCVVVKANRGVLLFVNDGGAFSRPPITLTSASGGPAWIDFDNDGYLDLYLGRGQASQETDVLLRNLGDGTFQPVKDAISTELRRRQGYSWGDLDNNGFMDLFEGSPIGKGTLYQNLGNTNHWLKLRLRGTTSNSDGIGAIVRVRATIRGGSLWQMQQVGGGNVVQSDLRPNFGLGDATVVEQVRIEWPSGNVTVLSDVAVDQILPVSEPTAIRPARPVASINGSVTLTNAVTGFNGQWSFEGAVLAGRTNRTLSLTNLQPAQAGRYSFVLQADTGPATNHVYLKVDTQFTKVLEGEIVNEVNATDQVTWIDFNGDGLLDAYVPHDQKGTEDSLFLNLKGGSFSKVTGSTLTQRTVGSLAGAVADVDNDGRPEVYVPHGDAEPGKLYTYNGAAGFQLAAHQPSNLPTGQSMDAAWGDYNGDGLVDLLVANGYNRTQTNVLYRANRDGTFTAVPASEAGALISEKGTTWLCTWVDFDMDGHPDVATVAAGQVRLYRNNGEGGFTRVPVPDFSLTPASWGLGWGDYDNDGFPDLFAGRFIYGMGRLYHNEGGKTFVKATGTGDLAELDMECFGVWGDYDNDGYLDLFVAGSYEPGALFRNRGDGTFESVNVGNLLTDGDQRVSATWVDVDNNGFLDLMLACGDAMGFLGYPGQKNHLYLNNGSGNHWLKIRLTGTSSNRDGIGAKVRVRATIGGKTFTQMREISGNSGYHGVPLLAHYGLGNSTNATTVRVEWPSGIVQELSKVAADQSLTIVEPALVRLTSEVVPAGIRLECLGAAGVSYELQASNDLKSWAAVATLSSGTGTSEYLIPAGTVSGSVFYRAVAK